MANLYFVRARAFTALAALLLLGGGAAAWGQEQQLVVRGLKFDGNSALEAEILAMAIATTKSSWWATAFPVRFFGLGEKRYFDEMEFRRDVVRLVLLYRQSGYMNAVVDTIVRRAPKDVYVRFRIHEGEPVRLTHFEVRGIDSIVNVEKFMRNLPLRVGDPFNRALFLASADSVAIWFKNQGYPYVEVLRNFDSDAGQLRAEAFLDVIPGPRMHVGEVRIEGLAAIDTATVRRTITVAPGKLYRLRDLFQSQRDLYGMDVFRSVNVLLVDSLGPPPPTAGDTQNNVRVLVRVMEGPRHRIRLGGGYGTVECFRTQAAWTANDFLGGGRTLSATGRLAKIGVSEPLDGGFGDILCSQLQDVLEGDTTANKLDYALGLTLTQPSFISPRHRANLGVFAERRYEWNAYTREAIGFNAGVTFNARSSMPVTMSFGYGVGQTIAQPISYCIYFSVCDIEDQQFLAEARPFASVGVSATRDRINSPLDPTRGSVLTSSIVHASRLVGSDRTYEFNRAEVEFARYHPIARALVFAWRLRMGTAVPPSITLPSSEELRARYVPPDQRFYGGGSNSVRGYGRNELGPRVYVQSIRVEGSETDTTVRASPTGGNSVFVANAELRLPSPVFRQRMRFAAYVDAGQVWERPDGILSFDNLRITPGVGVRLATPLGPVRFDVAYNGYDQEEGTLYREDGGDLVAIGTYQEAAPDTFWKRLVLQFAVGQAF